jgi:superfamily II DNA or RNA helicase
MKLIKRSGLLISSEYKNTLPYVQIKEHLQRITKAYGNSTITTNIFYLESDKFLLLPRNFPIHKFVPQSEIEIQDSRHNGSSIDIVHNIIPRGDVQQIAIDYLMNNEDGVLQLAPGVGKTVITIYMIAERKLKSLILVHRDSLADQWRDRIVSFTNLNDDDIARLTSSTFENDLQKPIIIATTQTFLSLLKRKRKDFLIKINEANIGIFVADEVHTSVGAPTFSECSIHIPSKYTYGLSATPYRYDGNADIIEYHLGPVFSDDDTQGTMDAKVTVILLDYQIDTPYRTKYIRFAGEFQRARYLNLLKKSTPFRDVLRGLLGHLKTDREFICIVERINLINELYDDLQSDSKSKFCSDAKLETLNFKHTFATPGKCRDGIDAPWKDAVIMTSPISNIEQLAGRVTRVNKNKKSPIIIDMVDYGCRDISRTFFKRKDFYEKKGWEIQYVLYLNKNIANIEKEVALPIIKGEK